MPRVTYVAPYVPMDEATVTAIVLDIADREMKTVNSLLTETCLGTEVVSSMFDAVA